MKNAFMLINFIVLLFMVITLQVFCQETNILVDKIDSGNLRFIENKNQWEKNILYKADLNNGAVFLEKNGFTFLFKDMEAISKISEAHSSGKNSSLTPSDYIINCHAFKVCFINSKQNAVITAGHPSEGYYNYFSGNDPSHWTSKVRSFKTVTYKDIYENTDLTIYENESKLKYFFVLHPGADIANIKIKYEGAEKVTLLDHNLIIKTSVNEVCELSPVSFQENASDTKNIACKFKLDDNILTFDFPDGYDTTKDLIIDPTIIFSTFSGSTADNWGFTSTYDSHGNVYSGGIAFGTGFPVSLGAFQINYAGSGGCDIAIIKYDSSCTQRLWATYLGGTGKELPHSMIVNDLDELIVYGTTGSVDYPVTSGAYDTSFNGGDEVIYDYVINFTNGIDIFVSRFSNDGTQLLSSTYVGGSKNDGLNYPSPLSYNYGDGARGEIMKDAGNNIYVVSTTNSVDFPVTSGTFQTIAGGGGQDGVVFKMDATLSHLKWSSFLGGSGNDAAYGIILDGNNNVFVTGGTTSVDFPTTIDGLHPDYLGGSSDGFVSKIDPYGSNIMSSTYYGSNTYDQSYMIDLDKSSNVYIFGQTKAPGNSLIFNAAWATPNSGMFISKMKFDLDTLIWSTVFGTGTGVPNISPTAFHVGLCNKIYLAGWGGANLNGFGGTTGLPVTADAFQASTDNNDFYLLSISDDASSIIYGSFFGSLSTHDHVDGGTNRFDNYGVLYQSVCGGCGGFDDFPTTPGAWSNVNNSSNCNNAVIKFDFLPNLVLADAHAIANDTGCTHFNYSFVNNSNGNTYIWNFGDASPDVTQVSPTHIYSNQGTFYVSLTAIDSTTCNISDSIIIKLDVLPLPDVGLGNDTCVDLGITLIAGQDPGYIYNWSTGETSQTINVYSSGYYSVEVISGQDSACYAYDTVFVDIIPTPVISLSNDTLVSNIAEGNQWYNSNGIITGATGSTYMPEDSGYYYVITKDTLGCISDTSNMIYFQIGDPLNISELNGNLFFSPNPTTGIITINTHEKSIIEILNIEGQILKTLYGDGTRLTIDIGYLSSGVYIIKSRTFNRVVSKKLIKE